MLKPLPATKEVNGMQRLALRYHQEPNQESAVVLGLALGLALSTLLNWYVICGTKLQSCTSLL